MEVQFMFRNINFNVGNKTFCSTKEDTVNKHCSSNFEPIVCLLMKEMNEVSNGKKNFLSFLYKRSHCCFSLYLELINKLIKGLSQTFIRSCMTYRLNKQFNYHASFIAKKIIVYIFISILTV